MRKNIAVVKELYLGKIIYFLSEKIKKMAEDTKTKNDDIIKLILDIYSILAVTSVINSLKSYINNLGPVGLRKQIKEDKFKLYFIVPPFTDVSFQNIKTAADHLNIILDEKVYIPELGIWTKNAVPVGVCYMQALEQTAEVYSNVRSYFLIAS